MPTPSRPRLVVVAGPSGAPSGLVERVADLVDMTVATNEDELRAQLPEAEILLIWDFKTRALRDLWHLGKNVRWAHSAAAGVDALMFPALRQSEVVVTNARGVFDAPMAEYALALLLYFAKRLDVASAQQREHRWQGYLSAMLAGSTLAIVGLGSIGRALAVRARALGMRVVGVRRSGAPDPSADLIYPVDQLRQALAVADYVVIFTPLTEETRGLFGPAELAAMKRNAVLVNLGRGGIVDEAALLAALREGRIRAALDVFAQEPLPPDSPLWDAPNLLISPHVGGDDDEANNRLLDAWAENVRRYVNGEPLLNQIDKARGY